MIQEKIKYAVVNRVKNTQRYRSAHPEYLEVNVNGVCHHFTSAEVAKAAERADKNTEDQTFLSAPKRLIMTYLYSLM